MHEVRHILCRMRLGETDRQLAKARLIGRKKAAVLRLVFAREGWLDPAQPLPEDAAIAAALATPDPKPLPTSSVEAYLDAILAWHEQGNQGVAIHQALVRKFGFAGHYSSVRRFLQKVEKRSPKPTVILDFGPGEAAQVDFGAGPKLLDPATGEVVSTWFFVMTLCWSRHQYVELVRDQTTATWLACHRHAFEWFAGVAPVGSPRLALAALVVNENRWKIKGSYVGKEAFNSYFGYPTSKGLLTSGVTPRWVWPFT